MLLIHSHLTGVGVYYERENSYLGMGDRVCKLAMSKDDCEVEFGEGDHRGTVLSITAWDVSPEEVEKLKKKYGEL